jgi:hypothetical protein
MTAKELNRDIKRLGAEIYRMSFEDQTKYFEYLEKVAKPEFTRLYLADGSFEYMNLSSVKIMLRLNVAHRFYPLHLFGININYSKLV